MPVERDDTPLTAIERALIKAIVAALLRAASANSRLADRDRAEMVTCR